MALDQLQQVQAEAKARLQTVTDGPTWVDSSGTPGNATHNAGGVSGAGSSAGRAAVDDGQSTCTITNAKVHANSVVVVVFEQDPADDFWVVVNSGNFVVTLGTALSGADAIFRYQVIGPV